MQWIEAKFKMPEDDKYVLAYHKKRGICVGYRWQEWDNLVDDDDELLDYCWDLVETKKNLGAEGIDWWEQPFIADDNDIPFWMDLPEPPVQFLQKNYVTNERKD